MDSGFQRAWSNSTLTDNEFAEYMRRSYWPQERIDACFATLSEDEDIIVVAADYVAIKNSKNGQERRFYAIEPEAKPLCPTCHRELP